MVKYCTECGASNPGGKFCSECGQQLVLPTASHTNSHSKSLHKTFSSMLRSSSSSHYSDSVSSDSIVLPSRISDSVPPAATGSEAQQVYEYCVTTIREAKGGNNKQGVKVFKQNCRHFGLKQMPVEAFYTSLVLELGFDKTTAFIATLARLVPDDDRRTELVEYNAQQQQKERLKSGFNGVLDTKTHNRDQQLVCTPTDSSPTALIRRESSGKNNTKGLINNRYADHPHCDVCNVRFEMTKRRHQCRKCGQFICSSCSPVRLLVPPGKQYQDAKDYDASIPQRVCLQCAPQLRPLQDELIATYAQSKTENVHEARSRFHAPYTTSLNKECCNAADIIGNFFRNDWTSSADRAIPVALLQKAHGLAIMTVLKAGFLVSGKVGTGLVIAKLPDGTWSAPSAIGTFGLSGGFEIGGEVVEVMIILGSANAVKVFHKPQVNLGAGLDLAVGPYGRSADAAAAASTSGLHANYSYSQSKGLFAGISLQGAILAARTDLNRKFYGRDLQPSDLLTGQVEQPIAAQPLYEAIENAMRGIKNHKDEQQYRSSIVGPCRHCSCVMFQAHTTQVWNKKCKTCSHLH